MNKTKERIVLRIAPFVVGLLFFSRSLLLTKRSYIGFENFYTMEFNFSSENISLAVLFVVFAFLAGLVVSKIGKKFGEDAIFLSVILVAEPLFFTKQMNCMTVLIANLALLFILNSLCEKKVIPNEVTLTIFLFASCVLSENAIFLFVLPAVVLYFIGDAEKFLKSTKNLVMIIISIISISVGMLLNDYLMTENSVFENFIKTYTFFENIYFKHIDYENILLFVFVIPTTVFGICFFLEFVRKCNKCRKKFCSCVTVLLVLTAYILSITGFILKGSDAFYTINYIVPLAIFSLLAKEKYEAKESIKKINSFVEKHTFSFVVVVVFLCFAATAIFYEDVDNLAGFILSI